ncbi:MAG: hypothetical protein PHF63_12495 [Herbinix sp.]|nr:hypothetical protein [Herbinix sp.]
MEKVMTPFGTISIYFNNTEITYQAIKLETNSVLFPNIDGRYKIVVHYESDILEHFIYCVIDNIDFSKVHSGHESGEGLECQAFYQENTKLSIGIECDTIYLASGERVSNYDYDSLYLKNGMGYHILPDTNSHEFTFGIAWINKCTDNNDVQTWYGADPTIL